MINKWSIPIHSVRGNAREAVCKGSPRKGRKDCGSAQAMAYYCIKILCVILVMRLPAYRIITEVLNVVL
jgi:hypothetical protein